MPGDSEEALAKSDLPNKLKFIYLRSIDAAFQPIIEPDLVALPF